MTEKRRVLVAEDEGIVARDIQNRLRALGYEPCAWVTTGEEALRQVGLTRPDLVLMDIRLQGEMDGIATAEAIRRQYDIPVVYLTAFADAETLERAKLTSPFGYILKPFEERDLHVTAELAIFKHAADREIAAREQWLATTLRSIGDAVIATDERGRVTFVNPIAERLTGWSNSEAVGRPLTEVFPILEEGTRRPAPDPVARVLRDGVVSGLANHTVLRSRDGRELPIGDSAAPITDDKGSIIGVVLVFRDLTEERAAHEHLERLHVDLTRSNADLEDQKGFLSALFESIPSAVMVVDLAERIQIVNQHLERIFGPVAGPIQKLILGGALHCRDAAGGAMSCGALESCQGCQIRDAVREAFEGRLVQRRRAEFHIGENGRCRSLVLLVSAAPLDYRGARMALLILEDVTELNGLRALVGSEKSFAGIVGRDRKMQEVFEAIREVAEVSCPVLIQGESGTGKELVARAIHTLGPRSAASFIPVNCGALPEGLLESELFGHVKGAFTGAIRDKKGRFELADGGTIFLDEIGDLSAAMQVKLLRVLQEQAFERVGGEKTLRVDVRIISATNKDLRQEIATGRFREDLFYRLCVVPIGLPPLRERVNDIPILAEHILEKSAAMSDRRKASVSAEAMAMLMEYPWPGNVRELQNALEFALIKGKGGHIETAHLPANLRSHLPIAEVRRGRQRKLTVAAVRDALQSARGNKVQAAQILGVSRATLYRFLEELERDRAVS